MGQMIDGVMAPSVTYVKTSEDGMLQPVYKTNMEMVAQQLAPQAEAVALSYAKEYKFKIDNGELEKLAIEWSVTRGSRSGRVAWQFIQDLAGKLKIKINY